MASDNAPTEAQVRASEFRRTRMARKAKALSTQLTLDMFAEVMNEIKAMLATGQAVVLHSC